MSHEFRGVASVSVSNAWASLAPLEFTVHGKPQPAGSKRAFVNKGRAIVTDDNPKGKPWQAEVRAAAVEAMNGADLLDGPLSLTLIFKVARPKGHFGKKGLRPSAPAWPTVRPDTLKLARAVEDALTGIVWRDDSQVIDEYLRKSYGEPEGVTVRIAAW